MNEDMKKTIQIKGLLHIVIDVLLLWPSMFFYVVKDNTFAGIILYTIGILYLLAGLFWIDEKYRPGLRKPSSIWSITYSMLTGITEVVIFIYFDLFFLYFSWIVGMIIFIFQEKRCYDFVKSKAENKVD